MAEDRKTFKIKDGHLGEVKIADEVVAIIAGLAATEVEGVSSMAGNITNELVSKLGMKVLSKGVRIAFEESFQGCSRGSIERYCECGCGAEYCLRLLHPGSICESSGTRKISN